MLDNLYVFYLIDIFFLIKIIKKRNNENVLFIKFFKYNFLKFYYLYVKMWIFLVWFIFNYLVDGCCKI